ncbi:hypothetical protein [Mesorhizobium retamae]|nr:hypothetical protein [Mesorhizobium sp. IRAMC:0171]
MFDAAFFDDVYRRCDERLDEVAMMVTPGLFRLLILIHVGQLP